MLVRLESIASSLIEGIRIYPRTFALAEAQMTMAHGRPEVSNREVIGNVAATEHALRIGSGTEPVTVDDICAIHHSLIGDHPIAGAIREAQNWIGTWFSSPLTAHFVPPPPEWVPQLLEDLVVSINETGHPPLVHAAVVHAQFETIHPFADGNGRTGRALIQLMLARSGLVTTAGLPISGSLVHGRHLYIEALNRARSTCDVDSPESSAALTDWIELLADSLTGAVLTAGRVAGEVAMIERYWPSLLSTQNHRRSASTGGLLRVLAANPLVTVKKAAALTGANERTVRRSIQRLRDATILTQDGTGKRNRIYEATDVIDLFSDHASINPGWHSDRSPRRFHARLDETEA